MGVDVKKLLELKNIGDEKAQRLKEALALRDELAKECYVDVKRLADPNDPYPFDDKSMANE
jgi:hypothetical protein